MIASLFELSTGLLINIAIRCYSYLTDADAKIHLFGIGDLRNMSFVLKFDSRWEFYKSYSLYNNRGNKWMEIALAKLICEKAQKGARDQSNNIGFATYARYVRLNRRLYGLSRAELETELNLSSGYITLLENGLLLTNELPKQMRSNMVDYFHRQDTRRYKMK